MRNLRHSWNLGNLGNFMTKCKTGLVAIGGFLNLFALLNLLTLLTSVSTFLSGCESDFKLDGAASIAATTATTSTTAATGPAAPTALVTGSLTSSSIALAWTDNATDEMIYEVERCAGASCTNFSAVSRSPLPADTSTFTETGLTANTIYKYRFRARGVTGSSDWLSSGEIATLPLAGTSFTVGTVTSTSAAFSWTDNETSETGYQIQRCTGASCTSFVTVVNSPVAANTTSFTELGLSQSTVYRVRVRAVTSLGSSDYLTSSDITTLPADPTALVAGTATSAALTFSWTDNATAETGYDVQMCAGASCTSFAAVAGSPLAANAGTHTQSGLSNGSVYRFRVRAVGAGGNSGWLTSGDLTTLVAAPSSLTVASTNDTSIGITWTDNASGELFYEVQRCTGASCSNFAAATSSPIAANLTSYTETGLAPSTPYRFRVSAVSAVGNSTYLTSSDVTTAPAAPTSLVSGTVTSSTIPLSWTRNGVGETSYEVERCTGTGCSSFAAVTASPLAASASTHTETGLAGATTYRFRVRAVRSGVNSTYLTSGNITTVAATVVAAACTSPSTKVIDSGSVGSVTAVGRGLWSDLKVIPNTNYPATAYYDGSVTGGDAAIKLSYWDGSKYVIESVAGDSLVAAGSATFVRLAFLNTGKPMVFWSTGGTTIKGAMRSAALGTTGTWTAAVLDTFATGASRALEVSVSPLDQVGVAYVTNSASGKVRFLYCDAPCTAITGFAGNVMSATDFVDTTTSVASATGLGLAWCKHNSSTYYPAVVYSGNTGATIRYASCLGALSTCTTLANWAAQITTVVTSTGTLAKLLIDSSTIGDAPKVLARVNAASLGVYQMAGACNAAPAAFTNVSAAIGGATSGTGWASFLKDSAGKFHIIDNESTTSIGYYNSTTTSAYGTWNAVGTADTLTLPALSAGGGGADISSGAGQIYISYGGAATPFNLMNGVVNDYTYPSNSASAIYYSLAADLSGSINLPTATGQQKNVAAAVTSAGIPGVVYVDHSNGAVAGAKLKFALRAGSAATDAWQPFVVPIAFSPGFPALAFDHNNKPWISYYDGNNFRYYLVTNSQSNGSGYWTQYQFPIGAKAANGVFPATDGTQVAMYYSGGVAQPVMIISNSTAAGGQGIKAARLNPTTGVFGVVTTIDAVGASFSNRLTADFDTSGNIVIAYFDLTTTTVKYNASTNGNNWIPVSPQISTPTVGREGLAIKLNPATQKPAVSYYDRANNKVYFSACSTSVSSCSSSGNWATPTQVEGTAGVSGLLTTGQEAILNTSLTYSASGVAYVAYMTGIGATTPSLLLSDSASAFATPVTLSSSPSANVTGASAFNFALTGMSVSATRNDLGQFFSAYVGPNNILFATSCGD